MATKLLFVFLCLFVVPSYGMFHKFFSGQCPTVDPLPDFNIDRFLGQWFVIESYNDNAVLCLRENFTLSEEERKPELVDMARNEVEQEKDLEQVYQMKRSYLAFGGRQMLHETGKIKFLSNESHSEMEISFPYTETGMLNMKHYQVVATDYDRFALVWRCQKTIFGHRRAAQIMSRQGTIDKKTLVELQTMLRSMDLDEGVKLNQVNQNNCELTVPKPNQSKPPSKGHPSVQVDSEKPEANKPFVGVNVGNKNHDKNKKKLIAIDVGGFHLSINLPFW